MMNPANKHSGSFRDPSGFIFQRDGQVLRQINRVYQHQYDRWMESGLYGSLVKAGLLIPHQEVDQAPLLPELAYKVIQPERVQLISYPYEWSFSQLQDAALATLAVVKQSFEKGFILKDASAYNIQFYRGRPTLIDTLSFETYQEGEPWVAYRQFCQHFLAPLALMALVNVRLSQLLRIYIDGVPLDLASRLLPGRTRLNVGLLTHIHMHAAAQLRYAGQAAPKTTARQGKGMGKMAFLGLIDSLESTVRKLSWKPAGTEWGSYYTDTNYTPAALDDKRRIVAEQIELAKPASVWDLGGNTGLFSRLAAERGIPIASFDIDPAAVELNYLESRRKGETNLLPLVQDLTNPSPALGWANQERAALVERGPVDLVMALALIHHLAISNNVPLPQLAQFFASLGRWLILEFVPKEDSQVQRLLATRADIFPEYHLAGFEQAFQTCFRIHQRQAVQGSQRVIYLLERLDA